MLRVLVARAAAAAARPERIGSMVVSPLSRIECQNASRLAATGYRSYSEKIENVDKESFLKAFDELERKAEGSSLFSSKAGRTAAMANRLVYNFKDMNGDEQLIENQPDQMISVAKEVSGRATGERLRQEAMETLEEQLRNLASTTPEIPTHTRSASPLAPKMSVPPPYRGRMVINGHSAQYAYGALNQIIRENRLRETSH